jgi:hypothetical protein
MLETVFRGLFLHETDFSFCIFIWSFGAESGKISEGMSCDMDGQVCNSKRMEKRSGKQTGKTE